MIAEWLFEWYENVVNVVSFLSYKVIIQVTEDEIW